MQQVLLSAIASPAHCLLLQLQLMHSHPVSTLLAAKLQLRSSNCQLYKHMPFATTSHHVN
jgi:hypothetical protein